MNVTEFWKNFKLGEEISVSGTFIYNGLRRYHEMKRLDFTDELFEFLYDISIGLERLLKISVVLFEHNDSIDQDRLEKSLITHNHLDLLARLKKYVSINFGSAQIDLLSLLATFYKSLRYDRFTLSSVYDPDKEINAICNLLRKHLQVEFLRDASFLGTPNEDRYRRFIRRTILKISKTLYETIKSRSRAINIHSYELRHGSKAETVFLREVDILDEDVLWKELIVFLMNTRATSGYLEFLSSISPLDFDPERISDYLDCFQSNASKANVMDELEHLYEEMEMSKGERLDLMGIIGSPNVHFESSGDGFHENEELV